MASNLTDVQARILEFLRKSGGWVSLLELDRVRLLLADDIVTVPALVGAGLVEHNAEYKAIRISAAGRRALRTHKERP